jgi:tetratricopeptide (TPR) repeat protein
VVMELAKRCAQLNLAEREPVVSILDRLLALRPEDPLALFNIGSFYLNVGDPSRASDLLEKAARLEPNESAIWTGLGAAQMGLGMPVNGERSLKKAIEVQKEDSFDVTPFDMLAAVLDGQGRGHEAPAMWREQTQKQPQNGIAFARLAQSLLAGGQKEAALAVMDSALETLDDSVAVKRVYAPILRDQEDFDRSMDFYEDVLEEAGQEVGIMLEYADVLVRADRAFEAERVLRDVIEITPDPNIKAQTSAWLIEIEQPKRIEIVKSASIKADEGDVAGALRDLKPLRNWLADYWKLWALLASLHNRSHEYGPAEEAAKKALEIFPSCEPAISELANALNGQDRHEEAYGLMGSALQSFPNSLPLALQFGLAAKRFGRTDEARALAKQIREAVGQADNLEPILKEMEE